MSVPHPHKPWGRSAIAILSAYVLLMRFSTKCSLILIPFHFFVTEHLSKISLILNKTYQAELPTLTRSCTRLTRPASSSTSRSASTWPPKYTRPTDLGTSSTTDWFKVIPLHFGVFIKKLRETKQKDNGIFEGPKSFIRRILKLQEASDQYFEKNVFEHNIPFKKRPIKSTTILLQILKKFSFT